MEVCKKKSRKNVFLIATYFVLHVIYKLVLLSSDAKKTSKLSVAQDDSIFNGELLGIKMCHQRPPNPFPH
jgi:hypothetical protein